MTREPELLTTEFSKEARGDRIYVDVGRNRPAQHAVAPYSVRPLPGAPASCPLRWDEVTARLDPARFTIRTIPKRFEEMEDPVAPVLGSGVDVAKALGAIAKKMDPGQAKKKRGTK